MKNNKGITLIALVVTIIVLLILAGVSIAMLTGENGILTNSSKAAYETERAEAIERINMALNSTKTEILAQLVNSSTYQANTSAASTALNTKITSELGDAYNVAVADDYSTITITYKNDKYKNSSKKYSTVTGISTNGGMVQGSIALAGNGTLTGAAEVAYE